MAKIKKSLTVVSKSIADTFSSKNLLGSVPESELMKASSESVCGKCGATIFTNLFSEWSLNNAVIICPECASYNVNEQINRTIQRMLPEVSDIVFNSITVRSSIFYSLEPDSGDRLRLLHEEFLESWAVYHSKLPGILYHYTSLAGLLGTLGSHSLWMTDMAYMNDSSELQYGIDLINQCYESKLTKLPATCAELLNRAFWSREVIEESGARMVACFCTNDDLLSQWRAYGQGGSGYNIGFDSSRLTNRHVQLRKVIYSLATQRRLIRAVVDKTCALFKEEAGNQTIEELNKTTIFKRYVDHLYYNLIEFALTFKHPSFKEENEWRLIYNLDYAKELDRLKFRQSGGLAVPYIALRAAEIEPKNTILPIVKITHGPVLQPDLTKRACALIMRSHGYAHAELAGSGTPLRV